MEQENLFTASKWDILKLLAEQERSPIELARVANTSVANISQQLRLLEMAGLVRSKRIANRDKGLPRVLYSLAGNFSYLIATTQDFVDKKMLSLSTYNKVILRIWFLDDQRARYFLEKLFWSLEEHLPRIQAILYDRACSEELRILLITDDAALPSQLEPMTLTAPDGEQRGVRIERIAPGAAPAHDGEWYALYDPSDHISRLSADDGRDTETTDDVEVNA